MIGVLNCFNSFYDLCFICLFLKLINPLLEMCFLEVSYFPRLAAVTCALNCQIKFSEFENGVKIIITVIIIIITISASPKRLMSKC